MTENKDNKKDNLEDIFNEVTDSSKNDSQAKSSLIKKQKDRKLWPFVAAGVALVGIGVGGYFTYPQWSGANDDKSKTEEVDPSSKDKEVPKDKKDKGSGTTDTSEKESTDDTPKEVKPGGDEYEDLTLEEVEKESIKEQEEREGVVEIATWAKLPYSERKRNDADGLKKDVISWSQGTTFINFSSGMPSSSQGFTDDVNKASNADGTPNMNYSYQSKENLEYNFGLYMNRLLNPVFGEWNGVLMGPERETYFPENVFKDMFTNEWWEANITPNDHSKLPIYVDWANDNYGGLSVEDHWYGEVVLLTATSQADSENQGVDVDITAEIKFTNTDKNGKLLERTGILKLQLVDNVDSYDLEHRNLINKASLTINK